MNFLYWECFHWKINTIAHVLWAACLCVNKCNTCSVWFSWPVFIMLCLLAGHFQQCLILCMFMHVKIFVCGRVCACFRLWSESQHEKIKCPNKPSPMEWWNKLTATHRARTNAMTCRTRTCTTTRFYKLWLTNCPEKGWLVANPVKIVGVCRTSFNAFLWTFMI